MAFIKYETNKISKRCANKMLTAHCKEKNFENSNLYFRKSLKCGHFFDFGRLFQNKLTLS